MAGDAAILARYSARNESTSPIRILSAAASQVD